MAFSITFTGKPVPREFSTFGEPQVYADIVIDEFIEDIILNTVYWQPKQYMRQWISALERLLNGPDNATSALITGMPDPSRPRYELPVEVWSMQKRNGTVYIHNQHVSIKDIDPPFDMHLDTFYNSIRFNISEPNVSEWRISIEDMLVWLKELKFNDVMDASVRLLVSDFKGNPREFVSGLMSPDELWVQDEYRTVKSKIDSRQIKNTESTWFIKERVVNDDIEAALWSLLNRMEPFKDEFLRQSKGLYVEWSIIGHGLSESGQIGIHLQSELLKEMTSYGGALDIDIYHVGQG